ncbi:MAG: hypothetical protein K2P85_06505 [Flavobacteriaceae bacterium]|nr:hypothetical protein [Flavobacteriaceae bacterium]
MPNRHYDVSGAPIGTYNTQPITRTANLQFTPRKQGSFAKIERLGTATTNYYWKVTNTDGSTNWYGGKNAVDPNAVIRNANNNIVHWALYMTQDIFGNCIKYEYDNTIIPTQSGQNANLNGGVIFHIKNIKYTGLNDANYKYEVIFNSDNIIRQDVSINARLGVKQIEPYFLNNIVVKKIDAGQPIRKYRLNLNYGKFNKGQLKSVSELDKDDNVFYTHTFEYYDDVSLGNQDAYFTDGVIETICNDTPVPCLDSDGDGVCNDNDPCPNIAGPESNNGCPEGTNTHCFVVQFPVGNIFNECLAGGVKVTINGVNLPGQPFYSLNAIISAIQIYHPIASYNTSSNELTISNTNQNYTTLDINSINYSCGWKQIFSNCTTTVPRSNNKNYRAYFSNLVQNNSIVLNDGIPPNTPCPLLFTNTEFLIPGYIPSFDSSASLLGSSKSEAISTGFYIGAGIGKSRVTKMTTFGVQWNWGNDKSIAMNTLIDINGDGLDDIVSKEVTGLYYKKHIVNRTYNTTTNEPIITHSFEAKRPITGIDNFYRAFGRNRSANFQITFGLRRLNGFIGWDKSKSNSETDMYFTDGNGDGLMDIVRDGVVYFNRLDANGNPKFIPDSKGTENLVITAEPKTVEVPDEYNEDDITLPAFDVVKVWEAPANGTIKIDNAIELTDSSKEAVVTVEVKKSSLPKCYSISFPVPYTTIKKFTFGGSYSYDRISPVNISLFLKKLVVNGIDYSTPSKLYITNGDINGYRNDCLNYNQLSVPFWFVNNPNPNKSPDFLSRCNSFFNSIENDFANSSFNIINYTANQNGCSGCCYGDIVDTSLLQFELLSQSVNTLVYNSDWTHNDLPLNGTYCPGPHNSNGITEWFWNVPSTIISNNGINTSIYVNGNSISNSSYTLANSTDFLTFKSDFENQYPSSVVTLNNQTNIITITINNTTDNFNTLTLTPTNGSNSNIYNFSQFQCGQNFSKHDQESLVNMKNDWDLFRYTKEELKIIQKKNLSEKEWIYNQKILLNYNGQVEEKDIDDLTDEVKISIIKVREQAQKEAQEWLMEYYKKQNEVENQSKKITLSRTINQNACNETPNELCLLYGAQLSSSNVNITNTLTSNCENQPLTVKKGDRIYFRVHSVDNGNPPVNWDPKVEYTDSGYATISDANGHKPFSSSYSDGFVVSGKLPVPFPGNSGTAKVTWNTFNITPTDKVTYQIIKRVYASVDSGTDNEAEPTQVGTDEIIYQKTCNPNVSTSVATTTNEIPGVNLNSYTIGNYAISNNQNLSQTFFYFKAISTSNVDWKNNLWMPAMEFTTTTPISPNQDGSNPEGNVTQVNTVYPIADYDLYRSFPCGTKFLKKDITSINSGNGLSITPQLLSSIFDANDNGKINFVVKRGTTFIGNRIFTITNGSVSINNSAAITLGMSGDNLIEIMFTSDDSENDSDVVSLLSKLALTNNTLAIISFGSTNINVPKSEINLYQKLDPKLGSFYRQWGQFMYRPANVTGALPTGIAGTNLIKEEALQVALSQSQVSQLNTSLGAVNDNMTQSQLQDFQNNQNNQNILNSIAFISANPTRKLINGIITDRWIGFHDENYASEFAYKAEKMTQAVTNFEDNYPNIEQAVLNTGAYAISKFSKGNSDNNFSFGISGFGVGINASVSDNGLNNSLTDYVDYNGDRYPDIVSTNNIQYTNKTGGLFTALAGNGNISQSSSDSSGIGASGTFGKSNQEGGDTDSKGSGFDRFEGFKGNSGAGISGNFTNGSSKTKRLWTDINGDGLSDVIELNTILVGGIPSPVTNVILNFGPTSSNTVQNNWGSLPLFASESSAISGGLGINKWQGSVEAGVSLATSWNKTTNTLVDINGDGLLDMIYANNELSVKLNLGNQFVDRGIWSNSYNLTKESSTTSSSLNTGVTIAWIWRLFGFPIKFPALNWNGTPLSTSTNKTKKSMTDFDGDGYVDLVEEIAPNTVKVYYSRIRRTDMLKSVNNPLGGKFTIDYKVQPIDYNNSQAKWAMSDVIIEDNYDKVNDGTDIYKKHFVYENGRYDRREREFYGYKTVKSEDYTVDTSGNTILYRTSVSNYHNQSYFLNGLLEDSYVIKGGDITKKFSRTKNFYSIYKLNNTNDEIDLSLAQPLTYDVGGAEGRRSAAVLLTKTVNELFELAPTPLLTTEVNLKYDTKGRVVQYFNKGNINDPNDDYTSTISYHNSLNALNIINIPKSIQVNTTSGVLLRERKTDVDSTNGNITSIFANNSNNWIETNMEYYPDGNLKRIIYPENTANQRMFYDYTYDSDYGKYIIGIKDAFGYISSATYNSDFDKIEETIDLTGNKMQYSYDSYGRNTIILAPKEIEAGVSHTIKFEYYPFHYLLPSGSVNSNEFVPVAVTSHFDQQHPNDDIETYTFIDGLGRPIQVKKDVYINTGTASNPNFVEALSVSGKTFYDDLGRATEQYHPWWEAKDNNTKFALNEYNSTFKSTSEFDELDRPIKSTDPEGNVSTMQYTLAPDVNNVMAIKTKSDVDQNGIQNIVTETYKDVAGRVISTKNVGGNNGSIWTKFKYNEIGELLSYTDTENITTTYKYDMLGRKTLVDHPDNGKTTFKYDNVNLISLQTANLQNNGTQINYKYFINRLTDIIYPTTPGGNPNIANVEYKYGDNGNQTGRLIWQRDATGTQDFEYGNMGEMISNIRTVVGPNIPTRIFKTLFDYDSWNRLQTMQYPDGEKVAYKYDLGGNLNEVIGDYNGTSYSYIKRIDYDYYEQRTYLKYGNNTETFYSYTPALRRLQNLNVKTSDGNNLFDNKYDYDNVGNVVGIKNSAGVTSNNLAGRYNHKFEYDNLNRLATANGSFDGSMTQIASGNDANSDYVLKMKYNDTHGIINKTQNHIKNGNAYLPNTYDNVYEYLANTHKVKQIKDNSTGDIENFQYDLNGNIIIRATSTLHRSFSWDESNRLRVVADNSAMQHYIYDASGERVLKANSDVEAVYQNGTLINPPGTVSINGYTSYPSAFIVITADGVYSKHYYAGTQRIVSRLGDDDASIFDLSPTVPKTGTSELVFDAKKLQQAQKTDLQNYADKLKRGTIVYKEYKPIALLDQEKAILEDNKIDNEDNYTLLEKLGEEKAPTVVPIYYYHPDHLGTSTALTDFNGNAYQFFLNLPFGETMAQQLGSNYYNSPYKFNGKELDEETGFYYYSARYYDPRISIWQSVDPLAAHSPNFNPYVYCNQNPIRYIDPTGMSTEEGDPPKKNWIGRTCDTVKSWLFGKPKNNNAKIELGKPSYQVIPDNNATSSASSGAVAVGASIAIGAESSGIAWTEIATNISALGVSILSAFAVVGSFACLDRDTPRKEDREGPLYAYRNMRSVGLVPELGSSLNTLGLREKDYGNGMSVTIGYGDIIPSNVPFGTNSTTLFRARLIDLLPFGLSITPMPKPDNPFYGQITPTGTNITPIEFISRIQLSTPAWKPIK